MINLIYARSLNGIIGDQGKMPWQLPEDLQIFKQKTEGHVVVMGRKTWESLPNTVKPLPGRQNVVVSNGGGSLMEAAIQPELVLAPEVAVGVVQDMANHKPEKIIWVIGGAKTFQLFLPHAQEIHETVVKVEVEGDTSLGFEPSALNEFYSTVGGGTTPGWVQSANGTVFRLNQYLRKPDSALAPQKKPWEI